MIVDARIVPLLSTVEAIARKLGHRHGSSRWDDLYSAGQQALWQASQSFEAAKSPTGEDGYRTYAMQRIKWAMLNVLDPKRSRRLFTTVSIDQKADDKPAIADRLNDRRELPPEINAIHREEQKTMSEQANGKTPTSFKAMDHAKARTPEVNTGCFAMAMKEAAMKSMTAIDMTSIFVGLIDKAKSGDTAAAKLLIHFYAGKTLHEKSEAKEAD